MVPPPSARADRVLILSMPRSASNLLETMLSKQPNHDASSYYNLHWASSWVADLDNGPSSLISAEDAESRNQTLQANYEKMLATIAESEKNNRKTLIKEHIYLANAPMEYFRRARPDDQGISYIAQTPGAEQPEPHTTTLCFPDSFLLSFQPVFTIRHPALMFTSFARALLKLNPASRLFEVTIPMSLTWTRQTYTWYVEHGIEPIIIEADDVINDPTYVPTLCRRTGMVPEAVIHEWETRTSDIPAVQIFTSSIYASTGVVKGKASTAVDLEAEKAKLRGEFGEELGGVIERRIEEAMADYQWLSERKMRSDGA